MTQKMFSGLGEWRTIGEGGWGKVEGGLVPLAVKWPGGDTEEHQHTVLNEAFYARDLRHPNIVHSRAFVRHLTNGSIGVLMEKFPLGDLGTLIKCAAFPPSTCTAALPGIEPSLTRSSANLTATAQARLRGASVTFSVRYRIMSYQSAADVLSCQELWLSLSSSATHTPCRGAGLMSCQVV